MKLLVVTSEPITAPERRAALRDGAADDRTEVMVEVDPSEVEARFGLPVDRDAVAQ
jgi:hypothetical protein